MQPRQGSRRAALRRELLLGACVAGTSFFAAAPSKAQLKTMRDLEVLAQIGAAQDRADALLVDVAEVSIDLPTEARKQFSGEEKKITQGLVALLEKMSADKQGDYVQASAYGWTSYLQSSGAALVPPRAAIDKELSQEPQFKATKPRSGLLNVALDIILDTIGIKEFTEKLADFCLNRNAALKNALQQLARAIERKNAAQAALAFEKFLRILVSRAVLRQLEQVLGRQAVLKILGRIALRLVPFVGWALWAAAFIVAVQRNWDKIVEAI